MVKFEALHGDGPADVNEKTGSNAGHEHKAAAIAADDKGNHNGINKGPSIVANVNLLLIERVGEANLVKNGRQIVAASIC